MRTRYRALTLIAGLCLWSAAFANVTLTSITVDPVVIGVNDSATVTVRGKAGPAKKFQSDCTAVEIQFDDVNDLPWVVTRVVPGHTGAFEITISHRYTSVQQARITASPALRMRNGNWSHCQFHDASLNLSGDIAISAPTLDVLGDTIRQLKQISPAVVNQQMSVVVTGFGACSQSVSVDWGDGTLSSIAGPVDLRAGGIASHTYSAAGVRTVTARGTVCDGVVTASVPVALFDAPGRPIDRALLDRLRSALSRSAALPPPPATTGGPRGCRVCDGLAGQITRLDATIPQLSGLAGAVLEGARASGAEPPTVVPVVQDLVQRLEERLRVRAVLIDRYTFALASAR